MGDVPDVGSIGASDSAFTAEDRLEEAGQNRFTMAESRLTPDMMLRRKVELQKHRKKPIMKKIDKRMKSCRDIRLHFRISRMSSTNL